LGNFEMKVVGQGRPKTSGPELTLKNQGGVPQEKNNAGREQGKTCTDQHLGRDMGEQKKREKKKTGELSWEGESARRQGSGGEPGKSSKVNISML